ncbi:MAG: cob(I)yrinic acid a,c-diamide adenosyltransferase, partial [Bacillota bacterium]
MPPEGWDRGYVQVYTGDGKGKTTAALGLALRAIGRGLKVLMIQFMKHWGYGEHLAARRLEPDLEIVQAGKPYLIAREEDLDEETREALGDEVVVFPPGKPPEEVVRLARDGVKLARRALEDGEVDLLILDEINVAVHYDLISIDDVLDLIDSRPPAMELVLTGRCAPKELVERADLVTEMKEIKHYYRRGVMARRGI